MRRIRIQNWPILVLILGEYGWTTDALRLTEEVVKLCKSKLGEYHADTLMSMQLLTYIVEKNSGNSQKLTAFSHSVEFQALAKFLFMRQLSVKIYRDSSII